MQDKFTHQTQIFQYDIESDWQRRKRYIKKDVTSSVQQPLQQADRKDTALDSASIEILNKSSKPILPMTRFIIKDTIYNEDQSVFKENNSYYVVDVDSVSQVVYSSTPSKRVYMHKIQLVESTKWLERFDVDNTTITNMLMFLYDETGVFSEEIGYSTSTSGVAQIPPAYSSQYSGADYDRSNNQKPFRSPISNQSRTIDCSCRMTPVCDFYMLGLIHDQVSATLVPGSFKVTRPDGVVVQLADNQTTYTAPTTYGTYIFEQTYNASKWGMYWNITFKWNVYLVEYQTLEKTPQRFTIEAVIDKVLGQVTRDNSIRRASQAPIFQLDESQRELLRSKIAPEFTFTQNTLFGILSEIGSAIHAVPRLLPADVNMDATDWSVIHYDFFGESPEPGLANELKIAYSTEQRGENYTTAFVTNVQNAFVSNTTEEYITITEPFEHGYISTRTEEASYEISNDHAVIKTSRPIQRITELWAYIPSLQEDVDIASYCKEKADYDLLTDYMFNDPGAGFGLGTKQTNIYYTRGDNVIRGLDYLAPATVQVTPTYLGKQPTIRNILCAIADKVMSHQDAAALVKGIDLVDMCFRIKYVPYLNLKTKQFREVIRDEMETSTLFFNQSGQQVDINAYGEHIKGALNMTSNEEPTLTFVTKCPMYVDIAGALQRMTEGYFENYKPYEINREISKKCCVTTIRFSKDFNKWNEYIAIKKNFRQYEISERECLEQNPIYNEFVIVDDQADYDKIPAIEYGQPGYDETKADFENYVNSLNSKDGYIASCDSLASAFNGNTVNNTLKWMYAKTRGQEWDKTNAVYVPVVRPFVLPVASFTMGNSAIANIRTADNYSAATKTERPTSGLASGYRLERAVQYGTKYGTFETLEADFGNAEFDTAVLGGYITQVERGQQLYSGPFTYNNNKVIGIGTNDPFVINKDSRQAINLTLQFNGVSAKDYIWLGSEFIKRFNLATVRKQADSLRLRYFTKVPDRFLSSDLQMVEPSNPNAQVQFTKPTITKYGITTQTPTYKTAMNGGLGFAATQDCVGWGLIDTNNNVILYYNKAVKSGETPPDIYLEFRDKI